MQKQVSQEEVSQEVVSRGLFALAQVQTWTSNAKWATRDEKSWETLCEPGDVAKCALVSRAWHKEFKAWVNHEQERVTEAIFERALGEEVALCSRNAYPWQGVPVCSFLNNAVLFGKRLVVCVSFTWHGKAGKHFLVVQVTKGRLFSPSWGVRVPRAVWWSRRDALENEKKKKYVEAWEAEQTASLGAWLRVHSDLLV